MTVSYDLSIVIPTYNSAKWLPSTMESLEAELDKSALYAEIILVDDGSTDSTMELSLDFQEKFGTRFSYIRTHNQGRFLARWTGLKAAKSEYLLFLDSRVLPRPNSLKYLGEHMRDTSAAPIWNGLAITDTSAPLVGLFWEVPLHVAWGAYLRNPYRTIITESNFGRLPKGTTMFFSKKSVFEAACLAHWPEANARFTNDDTKILRWLAQNYGILLDPCFSELYRPRPNFVGFLKHSNSRGVSFVDGFAGVNNHRNIGIISLALLPIVWLLIAAGLFLFNNWWILSTYIAITFSGVFVLPAVLARMNSCSARALISYILYLPSFSTVYWLGLWRGIFIHRKQLLSKS